MKIKRKVVDVEASESDSDDALETVLVSQIEQDELTNHADFINDDESEDSDYTPSEGEDSNEELWNYAENLEIRIIAIEKQLKKLKKNN